MASQGGGTPSWLWPRRYERQIARRYLVRRRSAGPLRLLAILLPVLAAAIELFYFFVPGHATLQVGMAALVAPLVAVVGLLLAFVSVFTTVAVVGVLLGVAALTVVMAVTSGFQGEIRARVIGLNAHVLMLKYGTDFSEYEEVIERLRSHKEVLAASPFVYNEMLLAPSGPGKEGAASAGVLVKGIDVARAQSVLDLARWMLPPAPSQAPPRLDALRTEMVPTGGGPPLPGMFIGAELARRLRVQPGDRVRLIAPLVGLESLFPDAQPVSAPNTETAPPPRAQEFRVAGVFRAGFDEYDRRLVLVTVPRAQELLGQGNVVTGIELRVATVDRARALGGELVNLLGGPPYRSLDWEELNHNLFAALALQKVVLALVLFLIILVAAFNIVASLTMLVIDKRREVAILKAMGMSSSSVAAVFRTVGLAIGALGVSLGVGMGLLVCAIIQRLGYLLDAKVYMIERLPIHVALPEIAITVLVTLIISDLATLYPALRAARLHPVDGLRYD